MKHSDREEGDPFSLLTPREWEVLKLLAESKSNKEIAWQLKITTHAANQHIRHLFEKLGVNRRTGAAVLYKDWLWKHTRGGGPDPPEVPDEKGA